MDVAKEVEGREEFEEVSKMCMLEDLQLAAELGKTLLERNKELETALRQHQNVIEDQTQEIEYLTKQTVALREVNDSRLRIYEQLEVSIQDLERANHRLAVDHAADKKHIKSLCANIESLESRCEELQKTVDDLNAQLEITRRRAEKKTEKIEPTQPKEDPKPLIVPSTPDAKKIELCSTPVKAVVPLPELTKDDEDLLRLSDELRESKVAFAQEHRRVTELEEQLASMVQENNRLHEQLRNAHAYNDEPKSMHEEFSILEEVRQGQLCVRCLRGADRDDLSSMLDDDDRSVMSSLILPTSGRQSPRPDDHVTNKLVKFDNAKEKLLQGIWANKEEGHENPYRELVQKYEALLEVQLAPPRAAKPAPPAPRAPAPPSPRAAPPTAARTPDFSEAETSSSGFADETSNKATQTERERPGSFLCTIADGEDYRFSIYDDAAAAVDTRFRNRPEYRELFKEIFTILKKAAENKDEGERLPLLDDAGKAPPATPAVEHPPADFTDDAQSVFSSVMSEQSIPVSDITIPETPTLKEKDMPPEPAPATDTAVEQNKENKPVDAADKPKEKERVLTPLVRQPLEYIAATRKKSRHRNRKHSQERVGADSPVFPSPIKVTYQKSSSRKRRDYRPLEASPLTKPPEGEWNGSTLQFYNRSLNSPTPSSSGGGGGSGRGKIYQAWNPATDSFDYKHNTAAQEIHKLRKLELSYAEVLRNAGGKPQRRKKHQ